MLKLSNPFKNAILKYYPNGDIVQGFGWNKELYFKTLGIQGHNGIDIFQPANTPVYASHSGTVAIAHNDPQGFGKYVMIISDEIDGVFHATLYGHLNEIQVELGSKINNGDQLGLCGNTGFVISGGTPFWGNAPGNLGVHLHFGYKKLTKGLSHSYPGLPGQSFDIIQYNNGYYGYIDPLPYLIINNEQMKHVIVGQNQYLLGEIQGQKVAYAIANVNDLDYLALEGDPEVLDNLDGYKVFETMSEGTSKEIRDKLDEIVSLYNDAVNL